MKYIVFLGDGMADRPVPELGGKTPLEVAQKPEMDALAQQGEVGMVRTVPEGMPPGSDTANLSVMGYDPKIYYSGRSPLEAVSMGIDLGPGDLTFRCNLVNLSDTEDYADATMVDYSSDEIPTEESAQLIEALQREFNHAPIELYPGISYRHCLVWRGGQGGGQLTPPHDISGRPIREYLPKGSNSEALLSLMERSRAILRDHPVNRARQARGLRPANSCWFWGEGTKPALSSFSEKYGLQGAVISAVDLIKGIALCAGLESIDVPGATGNVHTNFEGKAQAAIDALERVDFLYLHVEAPDEAGHRHEVENKVRAIELIDQKLIRPVLGALRQKGEPFRVLLLPDHPTPLTIRTHTADPVPFVLYRSDMARNGVQRYTEASAAQTGLFVPQGHTLLDRLLGVAPR